MCAVKNIPVLDEYDVCVIGGGSAGCSTAYTCAKYGLKTLIVEKSTKLGGSSNNALVTPMMRSYTKHHPNFYDLVNQLNTYAHTEDQQGSGQIWFSAEAMNNSWESLYTNVNGHILYDTSLIDVNIENGTIVSIVVDCVEGLYEIKAKHFVDATGDAKLSRLSGIPVEHGDHHLENQISSLRFEMGGIDIEKFRAYVFSLNDSYSIHRTKKDYFEAAMVVHKGFAMEPLFQKGVEQGYLIPSDLHYFQCYSIPDKPGGMSFNCPHIVMMKDNTSAVERSKAYAYGHQAIQRLVTFLKAMMPGFEHSFLLQVANQLGIRESWRIVGQYQMQEDAYATMARFEDAIARGDWYIDVHSASQSLVHQKSYQKGDYYEIPYRSLITNELDNLIVVGRCISATFLMQASIRIIPTCIDIGEAAGEAIHLCEVDKCSLKKLDGKKLSKLINNYR
ncbi:MULTISPECIES: FAD-dependent oxidoreductase [Terrabacteria group]|uniref:FAD-dependent oxidoreductase n=1 Tax=Bacillati TaxID=1783272 RepID=UPI001C6E0CD8|nr:MULTISPECIES: FAD-dependent oxidoreductase [Terrabacteria group]MBW9212762.1 FAD-dependent oxidoreductase [Trueperella sp. zg.1013]